MIPCHTHIRTGADKLMDLVKERSQITLTQASEILNVEKKAVEDWAQVLEDAGIIIIKTGLRDKVLMKPEYLENIPSTITRHVTSIFSSTESMREKELKKLEETIKKQMRELSNKTDQIKYYEDLKMSAEKELRRLDEKRKDIERTQCKLDKSISELSRNSEILSLKERDIVQREEQFKKDARDLEIKLEQLDMHQKTLIEREKKIHADVNSLIETHDKHKNKLMYHLEKMKK